MKHLGDITKIDGHTAPWVDCIIGGSPCQDLSIAGKRAGLAGARSGLFMEQIRLVKEMREASGAAYAGVPRAVPQVEGRRQEPGTGAALQDGRGRGNDGADVRQVFDLPMWQRYASPVWFDIRRTDVLNARLAREDKDEKHICPLQLEVIRRAVQLWTNSGDVVFSPFGGIGSEPYIALEQGRRAVAAELKPGYFAQMARNCEEVCKPKNEDQVTFGEVCG